MSMKYLLLNYFTNNFFYNNGSGSTYDQRTISTINRMSNKADIEAIVELIDEWYNKNKTAIDSIFKSSGVSSKSLDGFSISYQSEYRQSLVNLVPLEIYLALDSLGLWDMSVHATSGGYLW